MKREELEARLAELEAREAEANARAAKAEAALAAKPTAERTYAGITCKVSEGAQVLSVYGMQSRPVNLYASQWAKILVTHASEIRAFIIANADALAWKTAGDKVEAIALLTPVVVAPVTAEPVAEPVAPVAEPTA